MQKCLICGLEFIRLASHVTKTHKILLEDYVIEYELNGIHPTCACGCGAETTFYKHRFKRFLHTHQCKDPVIRQGMIDAGRRAAADPVCREKNSKKIKNLWNDETYLAKQDKSRHDPESAYCTTRIEKTLEALRKPEARKKASETRKIIWQDKEFSDKMHVIFASKEYRDKVSKATSEVLLQSEQRKRASDHSCSLVERGIIGSSTRCKREWLFNPYTQKTEYMHSSWESRFLNKAIELGVPVTKEHGIRIPYTDVHGTARQYVPDFSTIDGDVLFEIKGYMTPNDELKIASCDSWCKQREKRFIIIERHEMDDLSHAFLSFSFTRNKDVV